MRQQHNLLIAHKPWMDLWFFFVDIETAGRDFAGVEGGDEGGFVNDGATGRVDDDDAVFHF